MFYFSNAPVIRGQKVLMKMASQSVNRKNQRQESSFWLILSSTSLPLISRHLSQIQCAVLVVFKDLHSSLKVSHSQSFSFSFYDFYFAPFSVSLCYGKRGKPLSYWEINNGVVMKRGVKQLSFSNHFHFLLTKHLLRHFVSFVAVVRQ